MEGYSYRNGDYKMFLPEGRFQYNFSIYQIGYEKCKPHHKFGPIIRDFYILHFIVSGSGYLNVDGKTEVVESGDLFLVPVNKRIEYCANKNNPYEYYWVGFHGVGAEEVLKDIGFGENKHVLRAEDYNATLDAMKALCEFDEVETSNFNAYGCFYNLLALLTKNKKAKTEQQNNEYGMNKVIAYIEVNYTDKIMVDDLAKIANVNRSTLYRMFIHSLGKSPQDYIIEKRLDRALFLLKNTSLQIKEIAYLSGFSTPAYFCKSFKEKHKKSPQSARNLL